MRLGKPVSDTNRAKQAAKQVAQAVHNPAEPEYDDDIAVTVQSYALDHLMIVPRHPGSSEAKAWELNPERAFIVMDDLLEHPTLNHASKILGMRIVRHHEELKHATVADVRRLMGCGREAARTMMRNLHVAGFAEFRHRIPNQCDALWTFFDSLNRVAEPLGAQKPKGPGLWSNAAQHGVSQTKQMGRNPLTVRSNKQLINPLGEEEQGASVSISEKGFKTFNNVAARRDFFEDEKNRPCKDSFDDDEFGEFDEPKPETRPRPTFKNLEIEQPILISAPRLDSLKKNKLTPEEKKEQEERIMGKLEAAARKTAKASKEKRAKASRENPWNLLCGGVAKAWNEVKRNEWAPIRRLDSRDYKYISEARDHFDGDNERTLKELVGAINWAAKNEEWAHGKRLTFSEMAVNCKLIAYADKVAGIEEENRKARANRVGQRFLIKDKAGMMVPIEISKSEPFELWAKYDVGDFPRPSGYEYGTMTDASPFRVDTHQLIEDVDYRDYLLTLEPSEGSFSSWTQQEEARYNLPVVEFGPNPGISPWAR